MLFQLHRLYAIRWEDDHEWRLGKDGFGKRSWDISTAEF
jgi:hypothetical protein